MTVTHLIYPRDAVSIGEASRRTGVPVRTIRFYCDEGLLTAYRTTGGHRVFAPADLDRLGSIRRLRAVGLGLAAIAEVLAGDQEAATAIAAERAAVAAELDELSWRHAVLCALERAEGHDHALTSLAAVADRTAARTALIDFWRPLLSAMPSPLFDDFAEMDIPPIPAAPDPGQVLAFAELVRLVRTPILREVIARQLWRSDAESIRDERALLADLATAYAPAANRVLAGDEPAAGPELDLFVAAHARARGRRDTPGFRRKLLAGSAAGHPAAVRYWTLTAETVGSHCTTGAVQDWLDAALLRSAGPEPARR
ncbi:MerR family transcriptional regulator [Nocardia sp. NPDC024068]|uniref:MerR family transcriptional regulator n=1 Tax=Nocardia sp. NPDC024068 TaxID=3157197 RepID=UPI0033D879D1